MLGLSLGQGRILEDKSHAWKKRKDNFDWLSTNSLEVLDILKICFYCPISKGYEMIKTCAGSLLTSMTYNVSGHVGGLETNVKLRL